MSAPDRWGYVSCLVVACLLEQPERLEQMAVEDLAPGPVRRLAEIMAARRAKGLAADAAALLELPEVAHAGARVVDLYDVGHLQTSFPGYVAEARRLAAIDALRRQIDREAGPDPALVRAAADRLNGAGAPPDSVLSRAGISLLDVPAILAEPPPAPDWLWEGFIEHGETVWLAGKGKTGKSLLALFVACHALAGAGELLGARIGQVEQVVYLDCENRERTVRRRLHLAGVPPEVAGRISYGVLRGTDLGSAEGRAALAHLAAGGGLVILDSLVGLHTADEDKATEVRRFVLGLRAIAEDTGATIVGLAHENRNGNLRGSLDWRNAADTTLELRRDEAGWRTLKIADRRDGAEDVPPRVFRFVESRGRLSLEATAGAVRRTAGRPPTRREVLLKQVREARESDPTASMGQVARALGLSRDHGTFRIAWKEMISEGGQELPGQSGSRGPGGQGYSLTKGSSPPHHPPRANEGAS